MGYRHCLRGLGSGRAYSPDEIMNLDPVDGRPVQVELDLAAIGRDYANGGWYRAERRDMWRFGALLALDIADPRDAEAIVALGEGATPELDYSDHPAARAGGFRLRVKDEGAPHAGYGANPTLSFKDRGMAMAVSMARQLGLERLVVPTQGNAGDSLVSYALAGGMEAAVIMPEDTPMPVLGRVAAEAHRHAHIHLELVSGTIREAGACMRERYLPRGYFNMATFQEPGWRIEGKKTLGLELAEPREPGAPWRLPQVIVYPTGGGTGVLGMWKAFDELEALGMIGRERPRMIAVQASATAPLVQALASGADEPEALEAGHTVATGLNVPGGVGHFRVLEIVRDSGGTAVAVSEAAILDQLSAVWRERHWWLAPEGAACLAALEELRRGDYIAEGDEVAVVNTASLEKYLPSVRERL